MGKGKEEKVKGVIGKLEAGKKTTLIRKERKIKVIITIQKWNKIARGEENR